MRNVNLEENELTITAIFQQHTKEETIQTLKEALEVLEQEESDPENDEIIEIINSTVGKLQQIILLYFQKPRFLVHYQGPGQNLRSRPV